MCVCVCECKIKNLRKRLDSKFVKEQLLDISTYVVHVNSRIIVSKLKEKLNFIL